MLLKAPVEERFLKGLILTTSVWKIERREGACHVCQIDKKKAHHRMICLG